MKSGGRLRCVMLGLACGLASVPHSLVACAACYGKSDSRLAEGMNWGILTLLAVVASVLAGFAAFTIYHLRRTARIARTTAPTELPAVTK